MGMLFTLVLIGDWFTVKTIGDRSEYGCSRTYCWPIPEQVSACIGVLLHVIWWLVKIACNATKGGIFMLSVRPYLSWWMVAIGHHQRAGLGYDDCVRRYFCAKSSYGLDYCFIGLYFINSAGILLPLGFAPHGKWSSRLWFGVA